MKSLAILMVLLVAACNDGGGTSPTQGRSATPVPVVAPRATPEPAVTTKPAPAEAYYTNCAAARAAGAAPLRRGDAGYRAALDRDNDGVACE